VSDFHKRRNALYAEFPDESAAYEAEYSALQARLADCENVLRCIEIAPSTADVAIGAYFQRHADSASVTVSEVTK
jgi:hypothetical protein